LSKTIANNSNTNSKIVQNNINNRRKQSSKLNPGAQVQQEQEQEQDHKQQQHQVQSRAKQ
jgi:hypothetical protein